jgi:hypothetical protein
MIAGPIRTSDQVAAKAVEPCRSRGTRWGSVSLGLLLRCESAGSDRTISPEIMAGWEALKERC